LLHRLETCNKKLDKQRTQFTGGLRSVAEVRDQPKKAQWKLAFGAGGEDLLAESRAEHLVGDTRRSRARCNGHPEATGRGNTQETIAPSSEALSEIKISGGYL